MSAAVIGLIIGIVSALAGGVASYAATSQTNKKNEENYEDWKQYNTPANQMQRLSDAGLNPYMVNGVSNTLSQPFTVQNNQGISSLFSQLSQSAAQGVGNINTAESNQVKRSQLTLNKLGLDIRERMAKVAEKKGDAYTALLWSQGSLADLNAKFWSDMADVRRNKYISDATIAASNADFLSSFNPMRLNYYNQFYPLNLENVKAKTSYTKAQTSQLFWSRLFMQSKLEKEMALAWAKQQLSTRIGISALMNNQDKTAYDYFLGGDRINLQKDYYSLANAKWLTGLGTSFLNLIK